MKEMVEELLTNKRDALRLIANGLNVPKKEVKGWIKDGKIPDKWATKIVIRYQETEERNLIMQGKLPKKEKDRLIK